MEQVDFGYVGRDGLTIYSSCFVRYINARLIFEKPEAEWKKLVTKTETVFEYLVQEGNKRGFNVDETLELPSTDGSTCFRTASRCSKKIMTYMIQRGIKVNSIGIDMMIPARAPKTDENDLLIFIFVDPFSKSLVDFSTNFNK